MSMRSQGHLSAAPVRQFDQRLVYHQHGLIEGQLSYVADNTDVGGFLQSTVGGSHPDDSRVILYAATVAGETNQKSRLTFDCLGLSRDPTTAVWTFPASISTEPIETHAKFFTSTMAGAISAITSAGVGSNGAHFAIDSSTGKITGFNGFYGTSTPDGLKGVSRFYRGNIVARRTYFTRSALPALSESCKIVNRPYDMPAVVQISGITRWLYLQPSLEQIDKAGMWKVTEEYMAGTSNHISTVVYGDGNG